MPKLKIEYSREEIEAMVLKDAAGYVDEYEDAIITLTDDGFEVEYDAITDDDEEEEHCLIDDEDDEYDVPCEEEEDPFEWRKHDEQSTYPDDDVPCVIITSDQRVVTDCYWQDSTGLWLHGENLKPLDAGIEYWCRLPKYPRYVARGYRSHRPLSMRLKDIEKSEYHKKGWTHVNDKEPQPFAGLTVLCESSAKAGEYVEIRDVHYNGPSNAKPGFYANGKPLAAKVEYWKKVREYV
jgi:hypothetical protein